MNLKNKYLTGNNFILSPRGKISRIRYFVYTIILDILYKLFLSSGTILGRELHSCYFIFGSITILIIILKMFNYKKRAFCFLNNNIIAYLYSIFYLIIGGFIQEYLYLLKISLNKGLFELTQDPIFQKYANSYIPDFIGSNGGQTIFYIACGIGFVMYLFLLFYPKQTPKENKTVKKFFKLYWQKIVICILSTIFFIPSIFIIYSEIHWRAYSHAIFSINKNQTEYINKKIYASYTNQINEYNYKKKQLEKCTQENNNPYSDNFYCNFYIDLGNEPQIPIYYEFKEDKLEPTLDKKHYDFFNCDFKKFGLFKSTCGELKAPTYKNFHPYILFWTLLTFMLLTSIITSIVILSIITSIIKFIKNVNIPRINNKLKDIFSIKKFKSSILSEKLNELNQLKEQGLITEEDYNNKKSKLLDDF